MSEIAPRFHDDTIERLRMWVALADETADGHAGRGGEARARANQYLAEADRHDEAAAREREIADERRWLLRIAEANWQQPEAPMPDVLAPVEQAPVEGLGLRDAALGRPSVGTRPLAQQPEGEAR